MNRNKMNNTDFRKYAHQVADWMADYREQVETFPVKPDVQPGDIKNQLPQSPPDEGETFDQIFEDFRSVIVPGMTHWQHPMFFGYFPANNSAPSVLAEMLTASLGAQCMVWMTSPAAEELEERVMEWMRQLLGLPEHLTGVIQDSSSSATLVAILTAREKRSGYAINRAGFSGSERFRVYTSSQGHSSIDKDVKVAGLGIENLVKIEVDDTFAMIPAKLEEAILRDKASGYTPLCVVATIGTTSSTAVDPIDAIGNICTAHGCWLHIDASYAGTALMLPEMRWMSRGMEKADSFVVNPHKWMFTNFDCSCYFVKDPKALVKTFSILPEYLKTGVDTQVNNYRDWGVPLGRRFRSLKLWFVLRSYGVEGLQKKIRDHIALGVWLEEAVRLTPGFEIMVPRNLNLVCFRYHPEGIDDEGVLDSLNEKLMAEVNESGKMYLSQTRLNGKYVLRMVPGQTEVELRHVQQAFDWVCRKTDNL